MRTRPGSPAPLGATWDGAGVNFALFSENAQGVELCLFDAEGEEEVRVPVTDIVTIGAGGGSIAWIAESGALSGGRGGYRLARPLDALALPATVKDVLAARIDLDEARLLAIAPSVDLDLVRLHLAAIPRIGPQPQDACATALANARL